MTERIRIGKPDRTQTGYGHIFVFAIRQNTGNRHDFIQGHAAAFQRRVHFHGIEDVTIKNRTDRKTHRLFKNAPYQTETKI